MAWPGAGAGRLRCRAARQRFPAPPGSAASARRRRRARSGFVTAASQGGGSGEAGARRAPGSAFKGAAAAARAVPSPSASYVTAAAPPREAPGESNLSEAGSASGRSGFQPVCPEHSCPPRRGLFRGYSITLQSRPRQNRPQVTVSDFPFPKRTAHRDRWVQSHPTARALPSTLILRL